MSRRITRRRMLQGTAMGGVGLCLGRGARLVRAASANEKVNVAFVGLGGQGGSNLGGVSKHRDMANVVALCDVDDVRAGKAYVAFGRAKKYYDYRKMLDEMEKEIDAVVVSTPDHTHFHAAMKAMGMGKHLYCEKPMAHAIAEVRAMTELAAKKKLATQLGCQRHEKENMRRIVELIQSGAIGDVTEVFARKGGDRGMPEMPTEFPPVPSTLKWDLWLGPATERRYTPDYVPYKWRFWWDFGTGETGNWGCHILDIPFWALDLKYPTKVSASGPPVDKERTPKAMSSRFEFPARGSKPPVTLHWVHGKGLPPEMTERNLPTFGSVLFVGSKGMLACDFDKRKLYPEEKFAEFKGPEPTIPVPPDFRREWLLAVKGGKPASVNFDYSGPLTETVLLGNVAYRVGQGFDWDAKAMKAVGCAGAEGLIRPTYRKGWEV
ncbi:MAG: Gfo/Idh/MocA family oxidoreductase [Phycisphaerae bacterium]|nr:Gfo/Idh/MocA family oxidoreductase [Phycisphaerae bacterium]